MERRGLNLKSDTDVALIIEIISDEMAEHSDVGADDDADDYLPNTSSTSYSEPACSDSDQDNPHYDLQDGVEPVQEKQDKANSSSSSSDNDGDSWSDDNLTWSKTGHEPTTFSNTDYKEAFGISRKAQVDVVSPLAIFSLIFTELFLNLVVCESNLYALQAHQTLDLTVEELKAFFGVLIIMGLHTLPSMRLYWSNDCNFFVSRVASVMPLKRFLKILRYLHLNDNTKMPKKGEPQFDRLYKVRPILNHLNIIFKDLFNPSRFLSVDESMVKFKGRTSLKQYMPMKPIKRGFKIWVIACAVTGYCLGMSVYEGKEDSREMPLGEKVVTKLAHSFEGLGYCLFFDNFFSGVLMIKRLLHKSFFSCGTIRQTRKLFPKDYLSPDKQLQMGDSDGVMCGEIGISKWKDRGKKSVCVISSMHNPMEKTKVLRTNKEGKRDLVDCPVSIADYNKYMGGVDHFDQLHSSYSLAWKSRRWWVKLFYYCLDAAIVNSYILYKTTTNQLYPSKKPMTHLTFRSTLASELIGNYSGRTKRGPVAQVGRGKKRNHPDGHPTIQNATRLNNVGEHLPIKGPTFRRCAHCSTTKQQKRSTTLCVKCDVALCINCFVPFHKRTSQ